MREKEISEGLGDLAHAAEKDHEVQMARADLYKLAKYAIKLHDMLKGVSEAEGLEGWVQSKITKSADMIGSVYHHMDYEESPMSEDPMGEVTEAKDTHCSDDCCGADTKAEDCTCKPTCSSCNCNAVSEGKSPHKKGTKKYKKHMAAMHAESLQDRLAKKLSEATQTCNECGNTMLTASEKKELSDLAEGERHGNSKIYKKCWKGCRKVAGKKRGEPGSCKCD